MTIRSMCRKIPLSSHDRALAGTLCDKGPLRRHNLQCLVSLLQDYPPIEGANIKGFNSTRVDPTFNVGAL